MRGSFLFCVTSALLLTVVVCLADCSSPQAVASNRNQTSLSNTPGSEPPASFPVIDAHIHTDWGDPPDKYSDIPKTLDELLSEMREAGVVGAVAHTDSTGTGDVDLKSHNIIHCRGVQEPPALAVLEEGLKSGRFGCLKIYLGYIHRYAYDEVYQPVYRLAEKYQVPVVFHAGDTSTKEAKLKYADPLTIDEVAVDFPKVTFVIAHLGNPWIETAAEVAYKNPNVYLDGSALLVGHLDKTSPESIERYIVEPIRWALGYMEDSKKLMYGTDWPLVPMKAYLEAFKKAVPKEYWEDVFYKNAMRVFKFPDPKNPSE